MSASIRHSSETAEHFTPEAIVIAARAVMGGIDLDPATTAAGNRVVRANGCFTAKENGFLQHWRGCVFLNPPGGKCDAHGVSVRSGRWNVAGALVKGWTCHPDGERCGHDHKDVQSSQKRWWRRLAKAWLMDEIEQAFFVGFSLEILQVTQSGLQSDELIPLDFPLCFPKTRIAYMREQHEGSFVRGASPPHASALVYLLPKKEPERHAAKFREVFTTFGAVVDDRERLRGKWRSP